MATAVKSELVVQSELLAKGLRSNLTKLASRGIDVAFVDGIDLLRGQLMTAESEQETLKARLKEKTAEVDEKLESLRAQVSEARKLVKIQIPQKSWKEYGINDQR